MNGNEQAAAIGGFTLGAGMGLINQERSWHRRSRDASRSAKNAQSSANDALLQLRELVNSGDMQRLGNDQVSDLLLGVAFPGQLPKCEPSAFAGVETVITRPELTEELAQADLQWPGLVNKYGPNGELVEPGRAFLGQNFATGLALGFREIRALLLGFTQPKEGVSRFPVQYFRFARGFATVVRSMYDSGGALSQDQWTAAWQRMLGSSVPGASGLSTVLIDQELTDGPIVTNTTTETIALTLDIPAGALAKIGDELTVEAAFTATGVNSTNTAEVRAYLDSTSGAKLYDTGAVNPAAGDSAIVMGRLKARTVGSGGQIALGGITELSGTAKGPANAVVSIDTTIAHKIVFTIQQSAASAGNTMLSRYAQVYLRSAPPPATQPASPSAPVAF